MFGNYLVFGRFQKRWVSLCVFCESHRSAIGTVNAVGTVMEIPALHQPTRTTKTIALPIRSLDCSEFRVFQRVFGNYLRLPEVLMHVVSHTPASVARSKPTKNYKDYRAPYSVA